MGLSPDVLYQLVQRDVSEYTPFGPVGLGDIPPDASYKQFASACLVNSVTKKWLPRDTRLADQAAKEKFFASNKKCKDWSLTLEWWSDEQLYGEFRRAIDDFLHPSGNLLVPSYFNIFEKMRNGPGAALGSDHNSYYAKMFSSKMATTSLGLYKMYNVYVASDQRLCEAEVHRRREFGLPNVVDFSKCSFVPKTRDISRIICVEPSLNMNLQLGLGKILEDRLRGYFGVDLSTQPDKNRRLAQSGSKDGSLATIDLSSASDSISVNLCREIFPEWFFGLLTELRSPYTKIDGEKCALEMISTMGNGFTFPLQTVIFSCIIRAAYKVSGLNPKFGAISNWACFGDDLIVETKAFRNVTRLLGLLGFETNSSKTFSEGPFRESCGTDWFYGQPVRGVYLKRLETPQDISVAINLLNEWSARTGISLSETILYLLSAERKHFYVPFGENMDAGIRVPFSFLDRHMYRYDRNASVLYRCYRSAPVHVKVSESGFIYPRSLKKKNLIYNPSGLLMSLLRGELVRGAFSIRHGRVRYRTKLRCTPFWDDISVVKRTDGFSLTWQQWETAVLNNMSNP